MIERKFEETLEEKLIKEVEEIRGKYPFEFIKMFITTKANLVNVTLYFIVSSKTFRADFSLRSSSVVEKSDLKRVAESFKSFYMQSLLSNFAFETNTPIESIRKEEIIKDNRVFLVFGIKGKDFYNVFNYLLGDNYLEVAIRLRNFVT